MACRSPEPPPTPFSPGLPLSDRIWAVVLAGGEGERLRPLTEAWLGRHVPKQYCTFVGTRSMLEHTLDRAAHLTTPERIVTVIARAHLALPVGPHRAFARGRVVLQPNNRDTGPGVFLALAEVHRADPEAMVAIFPSDHFVHPEPAFLRQVRIAMAAARLLDRLVLLGAEPNALQLDYGWVQPGRLVDDRGLGQRVRFVERFVEKPDLGSAGLLRHGGAVWNTMVIVGPLRRLWAAGRRWLPDVLDRIEDVEHALGTRWEKEALERVYQEMPERNFSRDLLQPAAGELAVVTLSGIRWSDWGTADRIAASLADLGKRPAFADVARRDRRGRRAWCSG
jgi:mannose-1-phosphate guanylyltransferase